VTQTLVPRQAQDEPAEDGFPPSPPFLFAPPSPPSWPGLTRPPSQACLLPHRRLGPRVRPGDDDREIGDKGAAATMDDSPARPGCSALVPPRVNAALARLRPGAGSPHEVRQGLANAIGARQMTTYASGLWPRPEPVCLSAPLPARRDIEAREQPPLPDRSILDAVEITVSASTGAGTKPTRRSPSAGRSSRPRVRRRGGRRIMPAERGGTSWRGSGSNRGLPPSQPAKSLTAPRRSPAKTSRHNA